MWSAAQTCEQSFRLAAGMAGILGTYFVPGGCRILFAGFYLPSYICRVIYAGLYLPGYIAGFYCKVIGRREWLLWRKLRFAYVCIARYAYQCRIA